MKKLINDKSVTVDESLIGLTLVNPSLSLDSQNRVIYRSDISTYKSTHVTIISGGGSGHEPSHAGFVGPGMLSAAVCGSVFASPSATQVLAALRIVGGDKGVLVIVKNYTGDRLQFGKAVERAKKEGLKCAVVVVSEDCAISKSQMGRAGRRGLAGTLFVHKIAGAAAAEGLPLEEVARRAQYVADNIGTIGVSLTPCTLPGSKSAFALGDDEMEFGLGIHGEAGIQRVKLKTSKETVKNCLDYILDTSDDRNYLTLQSGDGVILLVNNLGGTSNLEMGILVKDAVEYLESKSIKVHKVISGALMTSLEMAGVSFSLLRYNPQSSETWYILDAVNLPVGAPGWPVSIEPAQKYPKVDIPDTNTQSLTMEFIIHTESGKFLAKTVIAACKAIVENEPDITKYDQISGDGDCGQTLATGAESILERISVNADGTVTSKGMNLDNASETFVAISQILEQCMGGSSGALYCLFFDSLANKLSVDVNPSIANWASGLCAGVNALTLYGGAKLGDRTMLDSLIPAVTTFAEKVKNNTEFHVAVSEAKDAAITGCEKTKEIETAVVGRASYLVAGGLKGTPDPGAFAVKVIVGAISSSLLPSVIPQLITDNSCADYSYHSNRDIGNILQTAPNASQDAPVPATSICACTSICTSKSATCDFAVFNNLVKTCTVYRTDRNNNTVTFFLGTTSSFFVTGDIRGYQLIPPATANSGLSLSLWDCISQCNAQGLNCDFLNFVLPTGTTVATLTNSTVGQCWIKKVPRVLNAFLIFKNPRTKNSNSNAVVAVPTNIAGDNTDKDGNATSLGNETDISPIPSGNSKTSSNSGTPMNVIIGSVIGGCAFLGIIISTVLFLVFKKRSRGERVVLGAEQRDLDMSLKQTTLGKNLSSVSDSRMEIPQRKITTILYANSNTSGIDSFGRTSNSSSNRLSLPSPLPNADQISPNRSLFFQSPGRVASTASVVLPLPLPEESIPRRLSSKRITQGDRDSLYTATNLGDSVLNAYTSPQQQTATWTITTPTEPTSPSQMTATPKLPTSQIQWQTYIKSSSGSALAFYMSLRDYEPTQEDELQVSVKDVVQVVKVFEDGWCTGINLRTGKIGVMPCMYFLDEKNVPVEVKMV
ncbi:hypothetical protein HK098_002194 [Nowakowskiella sp. JEL0407]|nr:hypothetical protein HK098_002194 [Nowakowskiella sp. JEL0407]